MTINSITCKCRKQEINLNYHRKFNLSFKASTESLVFSGVLINCRQILTHYFLIPSFNIHITMFCKPCLNVCGKPNFPNFSIKYLFDLKDSIFILDQPLRTLSVKQLLLKLEESPQRIHSAGLCLTCHSHCQNDKTDLIINSLQRRPECFGDTTAQSNHREFRILRAWYHQTSLGETSGMCSSETS